MGTGVKQPATGKSEEVGEDGKTIGRDLDYIRTPPYVGQGKWIKEVAARGRYSYVKTLLVRDERGREIEDPATGLYRLSKELAWIQKNSGVDEDMEALTERIYRAIAEEGLGRLESRLGTPESPLEIPGFASAVKLRQRTPYGNIHMEVVVNPKADYAPMEVFAELGNAGNEEPATIEALGRLTSLALRSGISMDKIIAQLKDIGSGASILSRDGSVHSIPQGFARGLMKFMAGRELYNMRDILVGDVDWDEVDKRVSDYLRTGEDTYETQKLPEEIDKGNSEPEKAQVISLAEIPEQRILQGRRPSGNSKGGLTRALICPMCNQRTFFPDSGCNKCVACGHSDCS